MLVFVKENYSQVKGNIKYWVKNCNAWCSTPVEYLNLLKLRLKQLPSTPRASSQESQAGGSGLKKTTFTQAKKRPHTDYFMFTSQKKVKSFKPSIKKSIISWL